VPEAEQQSSSGEKYRLMNIRNVPKGVKAALIAESERDERSVTDVANCILAEYFDTDCPEAGNLSRSEPTLGDQLQLRLPHYHPLWGAFWAAAREWKTTQSSAVIKVLADHYQQPYELVRRGRKPKAVR
jgi:hypothetical protein